MQETLGKIREDLNIKYQSYFWELEKKANEVRVRIIHYCVSVLCIYFDSKLENDVEVTICQFKLFRSWKFMSK